jgi:hypothetical protein
MAMTALMITTEDGIKYIQISTSVLNDILLIEARDCDVEFKPTGKVDLGVDEREEEEYHTELRKESAKRKQLVTSHSTDPEWNPEGYELYLTS